MYLALSSCFYSTDSPLEPWLIQAKLACIIIYTTALFFVWYQVNVQVAFVNMVTHNLMGTSKQQIGMFCFAWTVPPKTRQNMWKWASTTVKLLHYPSYKQARKFTLTCLLTDLRTLLHPHGILCFDPLGVVGICRSLDLHQIVSQGEDCYQLSKLFPHFHLALGCMAGIGYQFFHLQLLFNWVTWTCVGTSWPSPLGSHWP